MSAHRTNSHSRAKPKARRLKKRMLQKKVEGQLEPKKGQPLSARLGGRRAPDAGGADTHQGKQDAPNDGKDHGRRREGRLDNVGAIGFCAVPGQPAGERAHALRNQNTDDVCQKDVFCSPMMIHPGVVYAEKHGLCGKRDGLRPALPR